MPNDPKFNQQWSFQQPSDIDIDVPEAWNYEKGESSVLLAIIDTGVDWNHPDLAGDAPYTNGNIWINWIEYNGSTGVDDDGNGYVDDIRGWDWVDDQSGWPGEDADTPDNDPMDFKGHGTHVAGIAAAMTNNNIGIAGIAGGWYPSQRGCQIIALRAGWWHSSGLALIDMNFCASAINYARVKGATVINCSWESYYTQALKDALDNAINAGIIIVKSANNNNSEHADYLNSRGDCISVAATDQNDHKASISSYGTWVDVSAPGVNIFSTLFNDNYGYDSGTSMATPHVTGLIGLLRSYNSNLTKNQITGTIINSTDYIDSINPGYEGKLGTGRINASQAFNFLTIIFNNKSNSSVATTYNNGRHLLLDALGTLYLIFESNGEIYFRQSAVSGCKDYGIETISWNDPVRLSLSNGNTSFPSITGTYNKQFVVWQRYTGYSGGQYKYDIYLAKNTGSGWSTAKIENLSNLGFSPPTDPLPVVTNKTRTGGYRLLVCAKTSAAIKYITNDNDGDPAQCSAANNLPSYSATHKNPSLSMGPTTPASTVHISYDNGSNIYLNSYTSSWGAQDNTVCTGVVTNNNKYSSIEVDESAGIDVAWEGFNSSLNRWVIVHRRKGSSWGTPKYFEPAANNEFHRPSITGHTHYGKRSLVYHDKNGLVYRSYFDGGSWSTTATADGFLQHPNLSAGTTIAKYVFTGETSSPYQIYLSDETLPPGSMAKPIAGSEVTQLQLTTLACAQRYHRAAMIEDTTSSSRLLVQWGAIGVISQTGDELSVPFFVRDDSMSQFTIENVFDYLTSAPILLPANVDSLAWEQRLYGRGLERLVSPATSELNVVVELIAVTTGMTLAVLHQTALPISPDESFMERRFSVAVSAYRSQRVLLKISATGLVSRANLLANGGEVFIIENPFSGGGQPKAQPPILTEQSLPRCYELQQNFPNPFNATTTVCYQLPEASHVTLKIHNLLGQQVRTLVDAYQVAGYHTVQWDGRDDMGNVVVSGVYFYMIQAGEFNDVRKMVVLR